MLKVGFGSDIMTKERKSKKENINNFRILHEILDFKKYKY